MHGVVRAEAGDPLLTRVMVNGRRTSAPPSLADLRARSRAKVAGLPETVRRLRGAVPYQPKMTRQQVLAEIHKRSGEPTRLGELRDVLPAARTQRSITRERPAKRRTARRPARPRARAVVAAGDLAKLKAILEAGG